MTELIQLLLFEEVPVRQVKVGDIIVAPEANELIHVASITIKRGKWTVIGSWSEEVTGQARIGGGHAFRVMRLPGDWLTHSAPPLIRRRTEQETSEAVLLRQEQKAEVDADLIIDIFR